MTLSELFFGRVEMPIRASGRLVEQITSKIRRAIEIEEARRAEEARLEEERRRKEEEARKARYEPEVSPEVRYKTIDPVEIPPALLEPAKKCPPNLRAKVLSFSAQLLTFVRTKCDGRGVVAYKRSGIRRNVYSRIVSNDDACVTKRTAMQFCIGLQLGREEADQLLKSAGYAFSESIPDDIAFAHFIDHSIWNLEDVNEILAKCGLPTINFAE